MKQLNLEFHFSIFETSDYCVKSNLFRLLYCLPIKLHIITQYNKENVIISKKDGRVRWVSDIKTLNKLLKRPRYFLPSIPEIMQRSKNLSL